MVEKLNGKMFFPRLRAVPLFNTVEFWRSIVQPLIKFFHLLKSFQKFQSQYFFDSGTLQKSGFWSKLG